jgi:hypothetical protein
MPAEQLIELPRLIRDSEIRSESFNAEAYTVDVIWTTGATVRRVTWMNGTYDEELVVTPQAVRLDRLNAGAPFLNTHADWDLSDIIGSIVPGSAKIEKGRGIATVQLSRREDCAGIVLDIKDKVIRNLSVGYRYHKIEKTEGQEGDVPLWRVVDWEPMEISAVPIPADVGSQIRAAGKDGVEKFPFILSDALAAGPATAAQARMRMRAAALGLTN